MADLINLSPLPAPLRWHVAPVEWSMPAPESLAITAGPISDLFIDPRGTAAPMRNAPRLLGPVTGDFQLSARVTVAFGATFDAGVLVLWTDESHWAKLCFEYSPLGRPMVVSVVTRGVSDDANGWVVAETHVWLRVSRQGSAFAFHASIDGQIWEFVRHFALDAGPTVELGFLAQSPTGPGRQVTFEHITFTTVSLRELRDGS